MTEAKKARAKRETKPVEIHQRTKDHNWQLACEETFANTGAAAAFLFTIAKEGEIYRIVTVHRELTPTIETKRVVKF